MARRSPWLSLGVDAWLLSFETCSVLALRTLKMAAGGPAADVERKRMVDEKIDAGLAWQALAMTGGLGPTPQAAAANTLTYYRRKVRANRRRLSKA